MPTIEAQIDVIDTYLGKAKAKGAQLAIVPEEFLTLTKTTQQKRQLQEAYHQGSIQQRLAGLAKKHQIWFVAGTLPIKSNDENRFYSSTIVFKPTGEATTRYDKIHLFDVEIESGKESYKESEYVMPGEKIVTFEIGDIKIGLAICYDLRFPELFRVMMQQGVDLILLPSAFTYRTGEKHWETLLKARAIENLCYFCACNHAGVRKNKERAYGHSMFVGPWGDILEHLNDEQGMIIQTLNLNEMRALRKQFPALHHTKSFIMKSLSEN